MDAVPGDEGGLLIARSTGRLARVLALALVLTLVAPTLGLVPSGTGWLPRASALEFPTDGPIDAGWNIQTNGDSAASSLGDWYTNSLGGDHDHYVSIVVPCGWPTTAPVHVDLYSPDVHLDTTDADHGDLEEPGNGGTAQFALYGPYADRTASDAVQPVSGDALELASTDYPEVPASGAEPTWKRLTTIDVAATGCGIYLLRSTILETTSTAQNGWRLRVGDGTLGSPLIGDADGVPGTNDELLVGIYETTFQNDDGTGGCVTFHEYVQPGQTEIRFHNFDADNIGTLTYRSPSGATPGTPSLSGDDVWNNGRTGGDLISGGGVEPGWWEIVHCADDHNQFIQEGQTRVMAFLVAPPEPIVVAGKTGSADPVLLGETLTYSVAVTNDPTATGAAVDVEVTDVLPAGVTFVSCGWQDGAGACGVSGSTVTGTRGSLHAGATEVLQITVTVDAGATSPLTNSATVDFTDAIGNLYDDEPAGPVSTTVWSPLGTGEVCWAASDVDDSLVRFDRATGDVTVVGGFGVPGVEALAAQPGTGTLYAVDAGQLGTVNLTDGTFTATASTLAPATDVDGLTFHPYTGVLYGTQRNPGADELYVIDPSDGSVVGSAITIATVAGLDDIDDLAISPLDGIAYAIANHGIDDRLVTLDLVTGATTDLGIVQDGTGTRIEDIEGLSFSADGVLLGSTGTASGSPQRNSLYEITPTPGAATPSTATLVGPFGVGGDYEGLACLTAGVNTVSGLLFQDRDADGVFDLGEPTRDGVTVELRRTDGTLLDSTATAGGGAYSFTFAATGAFHVVLDTTDPSFDDELVTPASSVTIDYGSAYGESRTVDFWYRRGLISGVAWLDLDHDGQRDAGDPLVTDGSVEVSLWRDEDGDGAVDSLTDTLVSGPIAAGAGGAYAFTDLPQLPLSDPELPVNGYLLEVVNTGTRSLTLANVGADATDSDVDETTGVSVAAVLSPGDHVTDLDVGVWEPGAIDVTVFEDNDGDGTLDAGDTRLTPVDVTVYRDTSGNGALDIGTDAVVAGPSPTDASGQVSVTGLEPDTYFVDVDDTDVAGLVPSPTRSTGAEPVTVVVTAGVTSAVDIGYYTPIAISGHVWGDLDADGLYEPAVPEPLLADVTVNLRDDEGGVIAIATTDASGAYSFTGLVPDAYEIEVVVPGRVFSPRDVGGDDALDSDVDASGSTGLVTYPSGVDGVDVDAGTYQRGSISGRVWLDLDADGADEPLDATDPEPGLDGVTVRLLDDSGTTVLATDLTDVTGAYDFTGLDPAGYLVEVDPGTRVFSPQVNDSDVDPADGRTALITVTSNETESGRDAGLYTPVALSGRLWVDDDGDATQNDGATGIVGQDVSITGPGGLYTVTTGADGQWSTASLTGVDLAPGTYTIDHPAPAGSVFTSADQGGDDTLDSDVAPADGTAMVTLLSGESADLDAGVYEPVSIGDRVFTDVDGDGIQTAVDTGLNGATVELLDDSGSVIATTTSATVATVDGVYGFSGLPPGTYELRFTPAGSEVLTIPDAAAATESTDSDAAPGTGRTGTFTLTSGQTRDDLDAGLYVPASLGNRAWDDLDGDGVQDAGEPGLDGISLTLTGPNGFSATTTSSDGTGSPLGAYAFTGLAPGTYTLEVGGTAGRALSPTGNGTEATDSDPDVTTRQVALTLQSADAVDTVAVGTYVTSTVGDRIWLDDDGDGVQDGTEVDLPGVTVQVSLLQGGVVATRPDGTVLQVTTTTGTYSIGDVPPGDYEVRFDLPEPYRFTRPNVAAATEATDSDVQIIDGADATLGRTGTVTVDPAVSSVIQTLDAGVFLLGSISGEVWEDADGDALREAGEDPAGGTLVELFTAADLATPVDSVTTLDGSYTFVDLAPDDYVVRFAPPSGEALTDRSTDSLADPATGRTELIAVISDLDVTGVDAGVFTLVTLGDLVYEDLDGDGVQGVDEPGLGTTLRLHDPGDLSPGAALAITTSDAVTGAYAFTGVQPGDHVVVVEIPAGAQVTVADAAGDDSADSDVTLATTDPFDPIAASGTISLTSGLDVDTVDAGLWFPGSLSGRLFHDVNDNATDDGEAGWNDVRVVLSADHDRDGVYTIVEETSSDLLGGYAFTDLRPGPYRVVVDTSDPDLPPDAVLTTANQPLDVASVSDEDVTGLDIGYRQPGEISGTVFEDVAGDGDPTGDPGLSGVTVELRLTDGSVVATDTTDAAGVYGFTLLVPGTYELHVIEPPRYVLTTGNEPETVVIGPGETVTVDVGFQLYAPSVTLQPDGSERVEVGPGGDATVAYPHTVTNTGNVTDTYDLAVSGNTWTVTLIEDTDGDGVLDAGETTVVGDTGPMPPGASFELLAVVTVPAGTDRGVDDLVTVSATSQVGPNDPGDPPVVATATDVTTVVAPVLEFVKTSSLAGGTGTPGERVTYTIEITNLALDADVTDATGLTLDDVLADPTHGTFDTSSVAVDGVVQPDPTTMPLDLGTLAPGETVVVTVDLTLSRPLADGTVVTDIATATVANPQLYDAADQPVAEVGDTVSDVVTASPIPELVATATPAPGSIVEPREALTYRTTVSNRADATDVWRDVVFVQDLPGTGVSYVAGSATVGGVAIADGPGATNPFAPTGPGVPLGDLRPGTSVVVTLRLVVDDPVVDGTVLTGIAQAEGSNGGPLFGAVTHTVDASPGVSIAPNGATTVEPGTRVVYPHLLTNIGNVTDVYELTVDSDTGFTVTLVDDLDGDGELDTGEPAVSSSRTLAPDELQRLLVIVEVPAGVSSGTVDSSTVVATSTTDATVVSQAFDVTTVVAGELAVVKTAAPSSSAVNPGQVITYRLEVRNTGAAPLSGVVVTDDTPSSATYRPGTTRLDGVPVPDRPDGDGNPLHSDAGGLDLGDLPEGATRIITFDVLVRSSLPDRSPLVNVVEATSADGQVVTDSVSQLVTASPVIDVVKSATPEAGAIGPGDVIAYRIVIRNVGNAVATGVRLLDEVPRLTRYVPGSTTIDGAPVADAAGGTSPLTSLADGLEIGSLEPGGAAVTVTFEVTVDDPLPDGTVITNVADVTTIEGVTASSAPVRHTVRVTAGVTLDPDNDVLAEAGTLAVHPHSATNTGTGTDTLLLSATSASGWPITLYRDDDRDGTWDADEGTVIGSTGPLAPAASFTFFAVVDVPLTAVVGHVDVTTVSASSSTDSGVSATAVDTTTVVAPEVAFIKNAVPSGDQVNPGQMITYVLSVTNRGRVAASDLILTDGTPTGTTYLPGSTRLDGATILPDDTNGDGNPLSLANAGYLIEQLEPGQTVTLSFSVTVDPAAILGATIDNLATLQPPAGDELTSQRTHTVTAGPVLDLTKTAEPGTDVWLTAGDIVSYTITVANVGALAATGVRLTDDTPLNTRYVSGSATVAGAPVPDGAIDPNPFGSAAGGYLIGDLPSGASAVTVTFDVEVIESVADDDTVVNVARASAIEGASATSPEVQHDVDVTPGVSLAPPRDVTSVAGVTVTMAHVLTNTGDVPDSFDLTATSTRGWAARIYEDADGDGMLDDTEVEVVTTPLLAPGDTYLILVEVDVPSTAQTGVADTVVVRARSVEDAVVAARVDDTITVIEGALTLVKSASPATVRPGTIATYTLTVSNTGSAPVEDLLLFDAAPAGTTYVPGSVERDGVAVPDVAAGNPLEAGLALGTLATGETTVVTFDVTVEPDPGRTVVINAAEAIATDTPTARAGTVQPYDTRRGVDLTPGRRIEVAPGTIVAYPHTVTNTGDLADEIVLSASSSFGLPLRIVLDEDGDGVADDAEPEVTAPLALAAGESADIVLVLRAPADAPSGLEDVIVVTATSLSEPSVAAAAEDVMVVIAAVLRVVKGAQPDTVVEPGGVIRFGISVTNAGTEPARGLVITDPVPVGTTYVAGSTLLDGAPVADPGPEVSPLESGLLVGDLEPGSSVVVLLTVQVRPDVVPGAILTNVATAAADGLDPVPSTPVTLTVTGTTQLDIRKTVSPSDGVAPGGTARWTITITNVGSVEVPEVLLTDTLAPGLVYVTGSTLVDGTPVGDGVAAGTPVAIGGLVPGQTRTVVFDTAVDQLPDGTVLQNAATATNGVSGTSVLSNAAAVTVDMMASGLPQTGLPTGRTLTVAVVLVGSGWALLYVARPERRPRPVLQRRSR